MKIIKILNKTIKTTLSSMIAVLLFANFANAQKQLDQANRRLSFYGYWLTNLNYFQIFTII